MHAHTHKHTDVTFFLFYVQGMSDVGDVFRVVKTANSYLDLNDASTVSCY